MNKPHKPFGYKIGQALAYLIVSLSTILITTGAIAILKLLIDFILN